MVSLSNIYYFEFSSHFYSGTELLCTNARNSGSQLVAQLFNQDLQMAFRLRSEAIIPLHGCCRRILQRQVKAPEQVRYCQVQLRICEARREEAISMGKNGG